MFKFAEGQQDAGQIFLDAWAQATFAEHAVVVAVGALAASLLLWGAWRLVVFFNTFAW